MVVSEKKNNPHASDLGSGTNQTLSLISFSMQVLNCNYPITALDVSTDNTNSWQPTIRRDYNYFERNATAGSGGFGADRVTVRISCSNGKQVIIPDVGQDSETKAVAPVNC
jgi:expansin (peptidoglycan-binding protein)